MGLFDKLESKLEQGVNGAFARAFKSEVQPVEIASGIRRAMDDRASSVGKGKRPIVPNLFTIELSPTDFDRLSAWGDELDDELIASAQEHIDEQRYQPGGPLTIVLSESETLETGVFRLRPATAKAADALAHQRNHPRPARDEHRSESAHRDAAHGGFDPRDERADSGHRDDERPYSEGAALPGTPALGAGAAGGRTFGTRMKDYLRGGTTTPTGDAGSASFDNDHDDHNESERQPVNPMYGSGYAAADDHADSDGYEVDAYNSHPGNGEHRSPATGYANQHDGDGYGRADAQHDESFRGEYERDAYRYDDGADDAAQASRMPAPRAEGSQPHRHAWDDDDSDSDSGDPTGFEPAPVAPQRHERRPMSPRERPWLKIDGQRYPLLGAITVLGRDDEADIIIDDPGVSRRHSEIRITHDGPHLVMSLRDLGSTNGTYVNGDRIDSMHVHDGDRLTLGRTPMTIHLGDRP